MKNTISSLEEFVQRASKNKLWVFGWSAFVAILIWLISFYTSMPSEVAQFDQYAVELSQLGLDSERALRTMKVISDSVASVHEVVVFWSDNVADRKPSQIDTKVIVDGLAMTRSSRTRVAASTGFISGTEFFESELTTFKQGFEQDLVAIDEELALYEGFYAMLAYGNTEEAVRQAVQIGGSKYIETFAALTARMTGFAEVHNLARGASIIKTTEKTKQLQLFHLKTYLTWPALAYLGGFVVTAVLNWRQHRRSSSSRKNERKK